MTHFNFIPRRRAFGLGVFFILLWSATFTFAQTGPTAGMRDNTPKVHALINARIVVSPGQIIEKGTVVIRNGVIEAVGATISPPADAWVWDLAGLTIYPGLIETYSNLGLPKEERRPRAIGQTATEQPQQRAEAPRGPDNWNKLVYPQNNAAELFVPNNDEAKKLRELGFTVALTAPTKGIFRGSSALVTLSDDSPNKGLIKNRVGQHFTFETSGGFDEPTYPNSLLGAITVVRQSILDARWYEQAQNAYRKNSGQTKPEEDEALAALLTAANGGEPFIFEASDEQNFLRAVNIAKEFNLKLWARGSGHEYRRLDLIRAANVPVILPVNFPEAPNVETPEDALNSELAELQHWNAAPENPKRLQDAGVMFTLTTATLKNVSDFPARLRTAIERGLSKDAALAALTTTPAKLVGMENQLGSVAAGKFANFIVTDGDLFDEKTQILDTWVAGVRYENKKRPEVDLRGKWDITLDLGGKSETFALDIKGEPTSLNGEISQGTKKTKLTKISVENKRLAILFTGDSIGYTGVTRLSGAAEKESAMGTGILGNGVEFKWTSKRAAAFTPEVKKETPKKPEAPTMTAKSVYPTGGYGRATTPEQPKNLLVSGATIWTSGPQGKLENADLLISAGKIMRVGQNLSAPADAVIVDAKGKHVTPGLIDAHSHSAAASINEGAQAVTSEVRISDVIDSDDISIYRQLAGGLTVAHVMHGSANPIGGQNQTMKWRWGASAEELKFVETPPTIKFALGENVKQSNSQRPTDRYPQTRMGVDQLIRDRFKAGRDYKKAWADFEAKKQATPVAQRDALMPPRRDLELDALVEILDGKRLIHCHSYVQSEILMMTRIARDFGFKLGAFQHVLEGYKVADDIAQYAGGGSCFSDWWAYKFEVYDAIPYNGALMRSAGVLVSFNSDDRELARRMNLEAAKAVKYGNVPEQEALKFVTLNPAKQLKIDQYVGSLEPGKHADFTIWSSDPLSTYTRCEQTWVDGRKYFDRAEDLKMREEVIQERETLIQKVLAANKDGKKEMGGTRRPAGGHSLDMPSFSEQRGQDECEKP